MKLILLILCVAATLAAQPIVTTLAVPNPILNRTLSGPVWTLNASGGTAPYSWMVSSGSLPAGLSLASSGVIDGTPTATGAATFTIRVTDAAAQTATRQFTIKTQTPIGRGCTTATVIDWDCDYYGTGSAIGMDADDNDPTVNTPESMLAKYGTLRNFLSTAKGYNPNRIWYIAPGGNDSTCVADDATKPCGGFATARAKSSAGDALVFRGGSHLGGNGSAGADSNYFFMNRAGTTADKPDIFMGYPGESAVITHKTTAGWYGFAGAQNYLTIDGLIIQPHVTDFMWTSMLMNVRGNNRVVRNCEMKYGYDGIWEIYSQSDVLIERNVIHGQGGEHNIYIGQNADSGGPITRYVVRDNLLYGAIRNNFHNNGICNDCLLEGNIMYDANKAGGGGSGAVALQMGWNHSTMRNNVILTASAYALVLNNYYDAQPAIVPNDQNYNIFANNTFIRTATNSIPEDLSAAGTPTIGIINDFNAPSPKKDLGHNTWDNNIFVECSANGQTSVVSYRRAFDTDDDWLKTDTWRNNILWSCAGSVPLRSGVGGNPYTIAARDWSYFGSTAAVFTGNVWANPGLTAWDRSWASTPERFNLRPATGSRAVSAAFAASAPSRDIVGASRDGVADIGAYEAASNESPTVQTFATSAPSSSVVLTSQSAAQAGVPITVNRWFAKGEISQFPKPAVDGTTPAVWQSDVKIRWRDGHASCLITAATNTAPIVIACANHGYHEGERITVSGATGNTAANGNWTVQKVSADTFELLNSVGNGTYAGGASASGPGPGSVRHALVSFRYDRPAAGSAVSVSFANDPNQCSAGNSAACDAASLNAAGMLAFNGGKWAAATQTAASGITHSSSARTMLADGKFTYWLRGPAVTQVIAEDPEGSYDWGYNCGTNCWAAFTAANVNTAANTVTIPNHGLKTGDRLFISGNYPAGLTSGDGNDWDFACPVDNDTLKFSNNDPSCSSTVDLTSAGSGTIALQVPRSTGWTDDATHKSLHPLFILTFYTGWPGVKVEYAMQNAWASAVQDQRYDLVLTNSTGTVDSFPGYNHFASTVWRRVLWDGAEPGGAGQEKLSVKLDLNLPYLIYAKAVPPLMNHTLSETTVDNMVSTYAANTSSQHGPMFCSGAFGCGNLPISTASTSGADNVGLISAWDAVHLRTMSPQTRQMSEGNADNYGQSWFAWRENAQPSGKYDHAGTVAANGRWISVAARPGMSFEGPSGVPVNVGAVSPARLPSKDTGRHAESGMAYILSGEWWHLQIALAQASWMAVNRDKDDRRYSMGIYAPQSQPGYYAWPVRDIGYAALISPDGTPEQNYFQYVFNQNVGYWEGVFNIGNGRFFSQPGSSPFNPNSEFGSAWQLGRFGPIGMGAKNPLAIVRGLKDSGQELDSTIDASVVPSSNDGTSFMNWFLFDVYGYFAHAGLPGKELVEGMAGYTIGQVMEDQSKYSPYLMACHNCSGIPADEVEPRLTSGVTGSSMVFPVDMIPDSWEAPMTVFTGGWAPRCNGEYIRICSIDRNAKTLTVCAGGRGFGTGSCSGAGVHSTGDTLRSLRPFQSVRDLVRGFSPSYIATRVAQSNFTGDQGWAWGDDSYTAYAFSALSWHCPYTFRGATGQSAWDWMKGKFDAAGVTGYNGKLLFTPYMNPVRIKTTPGDTFLIIEYTKPRADQACTVDGVSDGVTSSRLVRFVKTGLTPSTSGTVAIHCTGDPYGVASLPYTTIAGLSGSGPYRWTAAGTDTRLNYGATVALGASTPFQNCASQCSATLPKGLQFIQLQRADGPKTEVRPVLIQ